MTEKEKNQTRSTRTTRKTAHKPRPSRPSLFLPVAPLKEGVLFPGMETKMIFTRESSKMALQAALKNDNLIFVTSQRDPKIERPKTKDVYQVGTVCKVSKVEESGKNLTVAISALTRGQVVSWSRSTKLLVAHVNLLDDIIDASEEQLNVMCEHLLNGFLNLLHFGQSVKINNEYISYLHTLSPGQVCDHVANILSAKNEKKQEILEELSIKKRLALTLSQVETEIEVTRVESEVIQKTHDKLDKNFKENVLRERLAMIQKELGDLDDEEQAADEYETKLKKIKISSENRDKIKKELKRFRQTSSMNPESSYLRNWLDAVFELPWGIFSRDILDLKKAAQILNDSHHGLQEVKDRVLEYIAVMKLQRQNKEKSSSPTILCFVGPPGVGKTSIGQSIADALGRKFAKISLGGVRDEAEIRGHRRTYVGAMSGRIVKGLKQAGSSNPVFMLDEIDKMAMDYHGDPSSALLEVLDPAQNKNFEDHYLDMPYDLSQVIFIATANTVEDIPEPLLDRMEIIRYAGYTVSEKLAIATKFLWPKALHNSGVQPEQVTLDESVMRQIIENYTREAGVRELNRQLDKILRKVARELVSDSKKTTIEITAKNLADYLGPQKFDVTANNQKSEVGVATGLAWTSVGGDVLFIEVALSEGKGELKLTGQLGDVMKESAQAAYTYVLSHAKELGIPTKKMEKQDVHLHVPEGAVPKDGPSAGVTMVTALVSALTGQPVKREVAMTGEVTLRGKVLRIGGLKEKSIAAARAGCKIVCIPAENERDLVEIPEEIKKQITFIPTHNVSENLKIALDKNAKV